MTDYTDVISQIESASNTTQIEQAISGFSASAVGSGGILYSGNVGGVSARTIAQNIVSANAANGVTVNIIDNTQLGQLLTDPAVKAAILSSAQNIYAGQGMDQSAAATAAEGFLFGSNTIAAGQEGSIAASLWGQASSEFAGSLSGNITVIGTAQQANPFGTLATVELPALIDNPNVDSVGGVAISQIKSAGSDAFGMMFTGFQNVITEGGLYSLADGTSPTITQQALDSLGFNEAVGPTAAELTASGLDEVVTTTALTSAADLLSFAGAAALEFLGGVAGGALVNLLTSSSPANAGEDKLLQEQNDYSDLPDSPTPLGSIIPNSNGSSTIQLPFNLLAPSGDDLGITIGGTTASSTINLSDVNSSASANYNLTAVYNPSNGILTGVTLGGEDPLLTLSSGTIDLLSNSSLNAIGSDNTIGLGGADNLTLASGTDDTVTKDVSGDSVSLDSDTSASFTGSGGAIDIDGTGIVVDSSDETVAAAAGDAFTLTGASGALSYTNTVDLDPNDDLTINYAAFDTVNGANTGDVVNIASGTAGWTDVNGDGGTIDLSATGIVLNTSDETVSAGASDDFNLTGTADTLSEGAFGSVELTGGDDSVTMGDSAYIGLLGGSGFSVTADDDTVGTLSDTSFDVIGSGNILHAAAGDTLGLTGSSNTVDLNSGGALTLGADATDTLNGVAGDTADLTGGDNLTSTVAGITANLGGTGDVFTGSGDTEYVATSGASDTLDGTTNTIDASVAATLTLGTYATDTLNGVAGDTADLTGGDSLTLASGTNDTVRNDVSGDSVSLDRDRKSVV